MLLIEGLRSLQRPTYLQTPIGGHHHQLRSLDLVGQLTMGMAHWHNPNRVNFFSNILQNHYFVRWNSYFYQHFSGWLFFANFQTRISYFFTMGLSPCTAWVGDRYIGEVISPFRTLPWQKMTAQFQFFQSLPHKKADFVKKSRQNLG